MDRPKIDGIVDYIKAAYPDSWRDYVLCRAGTEATKRLRGRAGRRGDVL